MEKERVFIWGTGKNERTIRERFSDLLYSIEIIGYIDNDEKKHNTEYFGYLIYSPKEAVKVDYDRIIVCSTFFNDIEEQLINELHVSRGKIDNFRYFRIGARLLHAIGRKFEFFGSSDQFSSFKMRFFGRNLNF